MALLAIKVKAFLVGLFLIGAFFYWFKWKGVSTCPEPFFGSHDFTPYHSSPGDISYSDPTIHTHSYDFSGAGYPGASYAGAGYSDAVTYSKPPPGAEVVSTDTTAAHYKRRRRVGNTARQKRSIPNTNQSKQPNTALNVDFTNLIFMFLNVNTNECRKRFVCEVDYLARSDMFIQFGYKIIGYVSCLFFRDFSIN